MILNIRYIFNINYEYNFANVFKCLTSNLHLIKTDRDVRYSEDFPYILGNRNNTTIHHTGCFIG